MSTEPSTPLIPAREERLYEEYGRSTPQQHDSHEDRWDNAELHVRLPARGRDLISLGCQARGFGAAPRRAFSLRRLWPPPSPRHPKTSRADSKFPRLSTAKTAVLTSSGRRQPLRSMTIRFLAPVHGTDADGEPLRPRGRYG
ncbi:hypothetical protein PG993_005646 [Apiospora rasikravindrae]|uniref:Uncharacterized protein n=1 Tax=Apiospora rasikravindrae TaxID=990691 RepID=A0ABR1TGV3_9PEZI